MAGWSTKNSPHDLIDELQEMGNELHTATIKNKSKTQSNFAEAETGLFCLEDPSKAREKWNKDAECFECSEKGHKACACPSKERG